MPRGVARDHEEKRTAIREASAGYFARSGVDRASMAGAARAAGVSKALIYHYWSSKEDLLFDILDAYLSELVAEVEAVEGPDRLRGLVKAVLLAYRNADDLHKLQLEALGTLPPERQAPLIAHQRRLASAIEEAAGDRLERDRLRAVTMSVFGMLNWFYMWHRPGNGLSREDYADLVADLTQDGLRGL